MGRDGREDVLYVRGTNVRPCDACTPRGKSSEYDRNLAVDNVSLSPRVNANVGQGNLRMKKIGDDNPLFG